MPLLQEKENEWDRRPNKGKVIEFQKAKRGYRRLEQGETEDYPLQYLEEIYRKLQEIANFTDTNTQNKKNSRYIMELERENEKMKNRLEKSFPIHIIVYLTLCSFGIGISLTLLVLRFVFHIYTIDPYYLICILLGALTLFATAATASRDWKDYIRNGEK